MSFLVSVRVSAPLEAVWARLVEFERWPEWNPACASASLGGDEVREGVPVRMELVHPRGRRFFTTPVVFELVPPRRLVLMTRSLGFRAPTEFALTAVDDVTVVALQGISRGPLAFSYRWTFPEKTQGLLWSGALTGLARSFASDDGSGT